MRTLLVTGPGGSGRTTVSAATALAAARDGQRTLLLTADRHDTLPAVLGDAATPGLTVHRVDSGAHFRQELLALQDRAGSALEMFGAQRLDDEELTELPGAEEFALLRAVRNAAAQPYDLVVVDLPPARQALALLALPAQLRRYLRRLLPPERRAARALRPMLAQLAGVPMPSQWLFEAAAQWDEHLAAVQSVIEADTTAVRLVAEPGPAGADALRTTATGLALHGLRTELLVANRVFPQDGAEPLADPAADHLPSTGSALLWSLIAQQQKTLADWRTSAGCELREVRHLGRDPRGTDDLAALALPAPELAPHRAHWPIEDRLAEDGFLVWAIPLPGAVREELDLVRRGDELVVTAGPFRRIVPLLSALRRCSVAGAGLSDGELRIRFTPDPGLWPKGQ